MTTTPAVDILKIIEDNLGSDAPKHFAVVHEVDNEQAAELDGVVEFVKGEATEFFEALAEEHTGLSPRPRDPGRERADFEAHLASGDLEKAGDSCKALADYLEARGERSGAASLWRTFGAAASVAGEHGSAAFEEAGRLLWESGYAFDADRALSASLREAQTAAEPTVERRIQSLLQRVRLSAGNYYDVLQETEAALDASGDDAPPSLVYSLRATRAEAQEMLHGVDWALDEYRAALDNLPDDALYFRTKASASVARLLADKYEWEHARQALNAARTEVSESESDDEERRRCDAILTLARANVHQALGEDESALQLYEDCAPVLEEADETALAVSALQGFVDSNSRLLHDAPAETVARLSDLARDSRDHRRIADLEQQGISQLAEGDAARDSLARAEAAAKAVHSQRSTRRVQIWDSHVLQEAGFAREALLSYVVAGERGKAVEVARGVRRVLPTGDAAPTDLFDDLLELASKGGMHSRGPAFVALKELCDVLPDGVLSEAVGYLSNLDALNSFMWADREVLAYAADLAREVAPRLDDAQASRVGAALVAAILRDDVYWTAHRAACLALARLVDLHPAILGEFEVPVRRLAEMADPDVDEDRVSAMVALVTLALAGSEEAETEALRLLESADDLSRARWRHVLGIATEDELAPPPQNDAPVQAHEPPYPVLGERTDQPGIPATAASISSSECSRLTRLPARYCS